MIIYQDITEISNTFPHGTTNRVMNHELQMRVYVCLYVCMFVCLFVYNEKRGTTTIVVVVVIGIIIPQSSLSRLPPLISFKSMDTLIVIQMDIKNGLYAHWLGLYSLLIPTVNMAECILWLKIFVNWSVSNQTDESDDCKLCQEI